MSARPGEPAIQGRSIQPVVSVGLHLCSTWQGGLYVAFVIDVFARRIVGWRVSCNMSMDFVLDALE